MKRSRYGTHGLLMDVVNTMSVAQRRRRNIFLILLSFGILWPTKRGRNINNHRFWLALPWRKLFFSRKHCFGIGTGLSVQSGKPYLTAVLQLFKNSNVKRCSWINLLIVSLITWGMMTWGNMSSCTWGMITWGNIIHYIWWPAIFHVKELEFWEGALPQRHHTLCPSQGTEQNSTSSPVTMKHFYQLPIDAFTRCLVRKSACLHN